MRDDERREGYFTHWDASLAGRFWGPTFGGSAAAQLPLLAFDAPPSAGFGMDHLRSDEALRWTRGHLTYVQRARAEAAAAAAALFGGEPYLAVHIRRGADRLHDFCHTAWGYANDSRSEALANSPSSTPRQRQIKLRAASSLGPPRSASAYWQVCSGWPWPATPALTDRQTDRQKEEKQHPRGAQAPQTNDATHATSFFHLQAGRSYPNPNPNQQAVTSYSSSTAADPRAAANAWSAASR